ncbi:MAG: hypothetical protein NW201_14600 [Gemmatimonadales bacterium]|nr:hypothetical protein [Gemmatimonadales bacterium]
MTATLLAALGDADEDDRLFAAEDLAAEAGPAAIGPLAARLAVEEAPLVRDALIRLLGDLGGAAGAAAVLPLLGSDDVPRRNGAVAVLGRCGAVAVPLMADAWRTATPAARKLLLDAAARLLPADVTPLVRLGLADDDVNVRITAVELAPSTGDAACRAAVEALAAVPGPAMLRDACRAALAGDR